MSLIEVSSISKSFVDELGYRIKLYNDVSLHVNEDEFVSILAPTGSGKSSLLKAIAKLEKPDSGNINYNSSVAYIPSGPSSFPWLNVRENIEFANSKLQKDEVLELVKLVGLEGYEEHFPVNKSFGFRFRISLARALAVGANVILLDEPFVNIHEKYRIELYDMLLNLKRVRKESFLLVTTNVTEALYLSDKIYLMSKHPGQIFEEIEVPFGNERKREMLFDEPLRNLRSNIENIFHSKELNIICDFNI